MYWKTYVYFKLFNSIAIGKFKLNFSPPPFQMNPQHTIPVLTDGDDLAVSESRAIARYVAAKYDASGKLYPECAKVRARIDERMCFDMGTLGQRFMEAFYPQFYSGAKKTCPDKLASLREALAWTEDFVAKTGFVAGTDHVTVADLAFFATFSKLKTVEDEVGLRDYKAINAWLARVEAAVPNFDKACGAGAKAEREFLRARIA